MRNLIIYLILLNSYFLKGQIEITGKKKYSLKLVISNSTIDTMILINPCSYYRLRKDNSISFYRNYSVNNDTLLILPKLNTNQINELCFNYNVIPIMIEPKKSFGFNLFYLGNKKKMKNKIIKFGYYVKIENNIKIKYATYKF